jgi:glycerophosphoryl diester phosphodiesterase
VKRQLVHLGLAVGLAVATIVGPGVLTTPASAGIAPKYAIVPSHVLVIAHRGFSALTPENTVPAMVAAARAHADMVEIDVQRTADGALIVVHDRTFARTTNVSDVYPSRKHGQVRSFTLGEVQQLDAGSWKSPQYRGTQIPTLDQVLNALEPTKTNLLLELKDPALYPGYELQVAVALQAHGFTENHRVHVDSFDVRALRIFHRWAPSVPVGLIATKGFEGLNKYGWLQTFDPNSESVSDSAVDSAHSRHMEVFAWPKKRAHDSPVTMDRLFDDGVNGVITNRPDIARKELSVEENNSL